MGHMVYIYVCMPSYFRGPFLIIISGLYLLYMYNCSRGPEIVRGPAIVRSKAKIACHLSRLHPAIVRQRHYSGTGPPIVREQYCRGAVTPPRHYEHQLSTQGSSTVAPVQRRYIVPQLAEAAPRVVPYKHARYHVCAAGELRYMPDSKRHVKGRLYGICGQEDDSDQEHRLQRISHA